MGGGGEPGELGKYHLDISGPTTLEDPRAGAASPGAALLGMSALALLPQNPATSSRCYHLAGGQHPPPQHQRYPTMRR
jgi:hypothetical protein